MNKQRKSYKRKKNRNRQNSNRTSSNRISSRKLRSMKKFGIPKKQKREEELTKPMEYEKPTDDDLKKSLEPYKDVVGKKNINIVLKNTWITEKIIEILIPSVKFNYDDLSFKKKMILKGLRSGMGDYYRRLIAHKIYYDRDWLEGVVINNIK